jgi:hypothetical protein
MVDPSWSGCPSASQGIVARFNKKVLDPNEAASGTVDYDLPNGPPSTSNDPPTANNWIVSRDDSVDIAFTLLDPAKVESLGADIGAIRIADFPRPDELSRMNTGSQVMSAGLVPGASGKQRNYPVFKFGYISSRPEEKVSWKACPVGSELHGTQWMIAASLVYGNSGSPILFVPVGFGGVSFGGTGRAVLIGVQSNAIVGWDIAGMAPIQFLIDSLKSINLPDADFSALAPISHRGAI